MWLLAATIVANTSFALILRAAQRRKANDVGVGMFNYIFASAVYWAIGGIARPEGAATGGVYGLIAGCFNVTIFLLLLPAMRFKGVAISIAMVRLAAVIPMGAAILMWHEAPSQIQAVGIILALLALPMLSLDKGVNHEPLTARRIMVLLGLFVSNGMTLLMMKAFQETGFVAARSIYLAMVFSIGALVCGVAWLRTRTSPLGWTEVKWGVLLGISNAATNILIFYTLDVLLASVMFPILAAVGLSLTTVFAAVMWREIPGRLGWMGIVIAVVAVGLANR